MKGEFIREANEQMKYETGMVVQIGDYRNSLIGTEFGVINAVRMVMTGLAKPEIEYLVLGRWLPDEAIKYVLKRESK